MTAKAVGILVLACLLAGVFGITVMDTGLAQAAAMWAGSLVVAFGIFWAIGAIVTEDWWPFRHI